MTTEARTYPLRLPKSLRQAVERLSKEDGTSINQFVVVAIAEKVSAMRTAEVFAERKQRANREAFREVLNRKGGKTPSDGDEVV